MIIKACIKFIGKTDEGAITSLRCRWGVMKNYVPKVMVKLNLEGCLGVQC